MIGPFLYTDDTECVLTDMHDLGTIFTFSSQKSEHTQNIQ